MASISRPSGRRDAVWNRIVKFPGLSLADLARNLRTSSTLVEYHVHALEKSGLVSRDNGAIFPAEVQENLTKEDRKILVRLRRPIPLHLCLLLLEKPLVFGEAAQILGVSKSGLSYHLGVLEKAEILERTENGGEVNIRLLDPVRLRRIIAANPPTPDSSTALLALFDTLFDT